jgi:aconitate hydratase
MQDATAQMALLQFMTAGLPEAAVPSTVHCDHLIQAKVGANIDLGVAIDTNAEVYDFLRVGVGQVRHRLLGPGSGIIHQVVLENYAFPGGMMIGTDSHTPNAGGLGMVAIGVGGADAVDVMTGFPFNVRWPKVIGVKLTGTLSGWSSPKDVILEGRPHPHRQGRHRRHRRVLRPRRRLDLGHRQGHHLQHGRRDRRHHLAVPVRRQHGRYLKATGREAIADAADKVAEHLRADEGALYDQLIEIDLDSSSR